MGRDITSGIMQGVAHCRLISCKSSGDGLLKAGVGAPWITPFFLDKGRAVLILTLFNPSGALALLIDVDKITEKGLTLDFEEEAASLPVLEEMLRKGECDFSQPLRGSLRLFHLAGLIEVEGHFETVVQVACSRCLESFKIPLEGRFALTFARELPEVEGEGGEEVELSADDMGLILFEGDELDLREALQEQVVMALPSRPLCSEDCRGLCPQCGIDLNTGSCDCSAPVVKNKFAALKDFKVEKKK